MGTPNGIISFPMPLAGGLGEEFNVLWLHRCQLIQLIQKEGGSPFGTIFGADFGHYKVHFPRVEEDDV